MDLTYAHVGATDVAERHWTPPRSGFRVYERSVLLGVGTAAWDEASAAVMEWRVKTRSGFAVHPRHGADATARVDHGYTLVAGIGPLRIREPVRVVAVVQEADRCGFAYGTGTGHPVSGEEAFVVWRDDNGRVWLTLRSLTRPASGTWRLVFPAILVAQRWYRWRYLRALRTRWGPGASSRRPR